MSPPQTKRFVVNDYAFDEMHLQVGDRVRLEPRGRPGPAHYGTLLGYASGESVLVRTPMADGLPVPYTDGEALTARAFTGVGIFSFDTVVERVCTAPFHYLHLAFPKTVRGVRIRTAERIKVTLPTEILVNGKRLPAVLIDLGVGGAMLECSAELEPGTPLAVHLAFVLEALQIRAAFDAQARVRRRIRRAQPAAAVPLAYYGVAFEGLTPGQKVMLQNLVYHHLLQDPRLRVGEEAE